MQVSTLGRHLGNKPKQLHNCTTQHLGLALHLLLLNATLLICAHKTSTAMLCTVQRHSNTGREEEAAAH